MIIYNPTISGSLSFQQGNNTITGETVNLTGSFSGSLTGDMTVTGDIVPNVSGAYDLGSESLPFRDIYVSQNSLKFVSTESGKEIGRISVNPSTGDVKLLNTKNLSDEERQSLNPTNITAEFLSPVSASALWVSQSITPGHTNTSLGHSTAPFHTLHTQFVSGSSATLTGAVTADTFTGTFVGAISSSAQIASDISGSFTSVSASIAQDIANISTDFDDITNKPTLISSSAQIAQDISGSFTSTSSSFASERLKNTTDTLDGDLTVTGKITAQEFHTEFVSASIIYQSGSTKFGNTSDDRHEFTGSIYVSNGVFSNLTGNVTGTASNASNLNNQGASYYLDYNNFTNTPTIPTNNNQLTNGAGYLTSYSETDTLASVTGRGSTTSSNITTGRITLNNNVSTGGFSSFSDYQLLLHSTGTASTSYGIGIEGDTFMFNSDTRYRFYVDNTLKTSIDSSGNISTTGTLTASGYNSSNWNTAYGWGNHASAGYLTSESNTFLGYGGNASTHPGTSRIIFTGQVSSGTDVLGMPTINNANAFLNINKHPGEYNSQLGFSSNGNIYYRNFTAAAIDGSTAWRTIWDSGNDGSGSGLDADTVDGIQAASFLRSDTADTASGTITFSSIYSGGTGDFTNLSNPSYKVSAGSGYWRIPHISNSSVTSGVYNFETGKSVYWGEPNDTGDYRFRGRGLYGETATYSPIFYDYNDTGYYVDPSSRSIFSTLNLINGGSGMQSNAALNIGFTSAGETRAIDIDGSWSNNESKSISFIHGTTSSNIVGQINCQHNSPGSRFRWGRLYHSGDSSTYTMELISESTSSAYLQVAGSMRSPIFYDSNDTNYYVNPNGVSKIRGLVISGVASSQSALDQIGFWAVASNGANPNTTSAIGFKQVGGIWADHGGTSGGYNTYFSMDTLNRGWIFRRVTAGDGDFTGTNVASIRNDGTAYFNGDVTANYSDIRLKTVLGKIENPIEKVKSLNGFYYQPNEIAETYGYEKERRVGVSAQDVERVLPEIVKDAPIGDGYKTVDYSKLVPLLIEAIKEQQQQIEKLKSLINK